MRGLTDLAPLGLTKQQGNLWESMYEQASFLYGQEWGSHVANKVHCDLWTSTGRRRAPPRTGVLPHPGNMISLGFFVDVNYLDPRTGRILVRSYRLPDCLWSERLRAVLVFPRMKIPSATVEAKRLPAELALYRKWHDGKQPKDGASEVAFNAPRFSKVFPVIAETYRSDKFDDVNDYVDYIHHNDTGSSGAPGPMVYFADGDECIMIRGGRLRLTSRGLIY